MFGPIVNPQGERLDYAFTPGADDRRDLVVIGHGVTAHRDRPWLMAVSQALGQAGISSLRFSFAGNGDSEGRFEDATITKEVDDLRSVLDAAEGWRLAYVGHSMGGAVGVLSAASESRISALVSLAGMVHIEQFMQTHFGDLQPGRDMMFDKPHCPLTQAFLDDAARIGSLLDRVPRVSVPWLVVHGTADEIVPLQDSLDLREAAGDGLELIQLPGVDHRFTGKTAEMTAAVVPWLVRGFDLGFPSSQAME
jgi:alpha/beta superfamily hydrolase